MILEYLLIVSVKWKKNASNEKLITDISKNFRYNDRKKLFFINK